ncbi:ClpB chaperone, Hsp100 family, partial [Haematococcus lacustris]
MLGQRMQGTTFASRGARRVSVAPFTAAASSVCAHVIGPRYGLGPSPAELATFNSSPALRLQAPRPSHRGNVRVVCAASAASQPGGGKKITQNEFTEKAWQAIVAAPEVA